VPTKPLDVRAKPADETSALAIFPSWASNATSLPLPARVAVSPSEELPIAGS